MVGNARTDKAGADDADFDAVFLQSGTQGFSPGFDAGFAGAVGRTGGQSVVTGNGAGDGDGFVIGAVQFAADASQKTPGKQIERKRAFFFFHFADKTIQRAVGIGNGRFGGSFFKDVNGRQNGIEDAVDVGNFSFAGIGGYAWIDLCRPQ